MAILATRVTAFLERLRYYDARRSLVIKDIARTFTVRVLLVGVGAATSIITARALGPAGRGLYAVGALIVNLGIQFGNLGLHSSNTYYVARERSLLPSLLNNSILVSVCLGGALSGLIYLVSLLRPEWLPVSGSVLTIALFWLPIALGSLLLQNLLIGVGQVSAFNGSEILGRLLTVILLIPALVWSGVTPAYVMVACLMGALATLAVPLWKLRSLVSSWTFRPDLHLLWRQACYGIRPSLATLFGYCVLKVDVLMVKYMAGSAATGYYSLASNLTDYIYLFPATVGMIIFPNLAAIVDERQRWHRAALAATGMASLMSIMAFIVLLSAHTIVRLAYGPTFLPAALPLIILSFAMIPYAANNMLSVYLAASGFPWFSVLIWGAGALFNVALNVVLIRKNGIIGAAISAAISYLAICLLHLIYVVARLRRSLVRIPEDSRRAPSEPYPAVEERVSL
jgi:O-antigen/teichoic acid export membrane protein